MDQSQPALRLAALSGITKHRHPQWQMLTDIHHHRPSATSKHNQLFGVAFVGKWGFVSYLSMITGSDGVSFLLPQLFFSQHRLKREKTTVKELLGLLTAKQPAESLVCKASELSMYLEEWQKILARLSRTESGAQVLVVSSWILVLGSP